MRESTQRDNDARGEQPRGPQVARAEDPPAYPDPAYPDPVSSQIVQRACDSTLSILATVHTTDLGRPTPCASWTVRDVVNHILGGTAFFAELAEAGVAADRGEDSDLTAGDFSDAFSQAASRLVAAFGAPGAMDKVMKMPMGELPGSVCAWIAASDVFTHGWDLAKATGQPGPPPRPGGPQPAPRPENQGPPGGPRLATRTAPAQITICGPIAA
jgi:uncharacterized protein (TIGR03086 family)